MKVLFVAAEAVPFYKTGGLADVIGALPQALRAHKIEARTILPRYRLFENPELKTETLAEFSLFFDGKVHRAKLGKVLSEDQASTFPETYLIDAPEYFGRAKIYGYKDDILRFGFFCRAVLESLAILADKERFLPEILHCHDWHTGLLPVYAGSEEDRRFKTAYTIHNLNYQGLAERAFLPRLGLDASLFNYHQLEFYGSINPLKGGLVFSDCITTVSPTYAREIQTEKYGAGLHGVLTEHAHSLKGILNGIDTQIWNPAQDRQIAAHFDAAHPKGKQVCKKALQKQVGLPDAPETPLLGIVSRLAPQKGFDLLIAAMHELLALDCQLIILGAGEEQYRTLLRKISERFPEQTAFFLEGQNEELAHQIYAGSDLFLMPSQYEPCGLGQMIALAYGTIPVVHATGGLADTVVQFDLETKIGNGFVFHDYNTRAFLETLQKALDCYHSSRWPKLMKNAFSCDFSWKTSAAEYAKLYQNMIES